MRRQLKKLREFKKLFQDIKADFKMFGNGVMPVKSTDTRWIDYKFSAMERVIDNFELSREKNSKNRATV